jgi:hypothetical protein
MDVRGDEERGAADAAWAPPRLHPVTLHALDELHRRRRDRVHAAPEAQAVSEAVDVEAGVDGPIWSAE